MAAEHSRVTGWIWDAIQADATLVTALKAVPGEDPELLPRIFADEAPQGAKVPLVLYAFLGGSDQLVGNSRLSSALWLVRAVGEGASYSTIEDIADRVDERITNVGAGGIFYRDIHILSCTREQPHQRKDAAFGVTTIYLGGFYRVRWSPSV